ncbi:hypothetical protein BGO17_03205 [Candidatus Saccharibacteria bacterium 49-20]|nr:MAG: hypothetical protein BGO17_03205 [Candidatus Saccharibacteria bacterium 49-20]
MKQLTQDEFNEAMTQASIRPRVKREVRFAQSTSDLSAEQWRETELLGVSDRAGNKGVLLLDSGATLYAAAYELSRGIRSSSGKAQPIICDFCRTWQTGSRSGSVTLMRPVRDSGSVTFLCCADLECSRHVRNLTSAAKTSRSQLREDMSNEERIERLRVRISAIAEQLALAPINL